LLVTAAIVFIVACRLALEQMTGPSLLLLLPLLLLCLLVAATIPSFAFWPPAAAHPAAVGSWRDQQMPRTLGL
jgi:hypothetical protein